MNKEFIRRRYLRQHLEQLSQLVGSSVAESDLMSISETERIREQLLSLKREPLRVFEIGLAETRSGAFGDFVGALVAANPAPVYFWAPLSSKSGLMRPVQLSLIKIGRAFEILGECVLVMITVDGGDELTIDVSGLSADAASLEVETRGVHWGHVAYAGGVA